MTLTATGLILAVLSAALVPLLYWVAGYAIFYRYLVKRISGLQATGYSAAIVAAFVGYAVFMHSLG